MRLGSWFRCCHGLLNLLDSAAQVVCFLLKCCSIQMTGRMGLRGQLIKVIANSVQLTHQREIVRWRHRLRDIAINQRSNITFL